jgi:hypothetical protein
MNIKLNIFRLGSIYKKLSRPVNVINHLSPPPPPPQYAKWGWCAALTLRQYLVCRECSKVVQHRTMNVVASKLPTAELLQLSSRSFRVFKMYW